MEPLKEIVIARADASREGSGVLHVVLPVLDETQAKPGMLAGMPAGARAIVVDNGSTDGSGEPAASLGARVARAAPVGWRVDEVSVDYRVGEGRSKITGTVPGTARTVRDMATALR